MNRLRLLSIALALLVMALPLRAQTTKPLQVVASFSILADMAREALPLRLHERDCLVVPGVGSERAIAVGGGAELGDRIGELVRAEQLPAGAEVALGLVGRRRDGRHRCDRRIGGDLRGHRGPRLGSELGLDRSAAIRGRSPSM